ncbi:MAG: amino acid ABC transporter substrate-binding protein [Firmicutes bacterium]|nr:amino acid ABC transporter substrate-binding protein [Bacillota bacterium]
MYDDRSDPQTSVRLTTRLITEDGVRFIFGPYSSGITNATSAIGERYRVITIATTANAPDLYERGYRYLFGTLPLATTYLHPVLEMAAALPEPPEKVAIITPENLFAIAAAEGARQKAEELGLKVVYFARYPQDTTDVSSLLSAIRDAGADMLLSTGFLQDGMLIVRQAKELRYNPKIMGFTVAASIPDFRTNLGRDAEGIMGGEWWAPSMAWEDDFFGSASQYAEEFEQRFGYVPTYHAASSSIGGYLLQLAIERAGTLDTEAVRRELLALDEVTMFGPIRFSDKGVNEASSAAGFQIQDGQIVLLWPEDISEGSLVYPKPGW